MAREECRESGLDLRDDNVWNANRMLGGALGGGKSVL